jgi:hypothetical protein
MDEKGDHSFKYLLLTFPNHQELDPKPSTDLTLLMWMAMPDIRNLREALSV